MKIIDFIFKIFESKPIKVRKGAKEIIIIENKVKGEIKYIICFLN
jgi:hypothetical protein